MVRGQVKVKAKVKPTLLEEECFDDIGKFLMGGGVYIY
jgi:hypothetical protein